MINSNVPISPSIFSKKLNKPDSVILETFSVKRTKTKVDLVWETNEKANNSGYEIQRKTNKGEWQRVAFVFPQANYGNSDLRLTYEYTDVNIEKEVTHYRLRQIDKDRNYTYSEVINISGATISW